MPPQPVLQRVVHLPPPLLAGDVDVALGVVGLRQRHQRADGRDRHADQDQRRQDRQADLQRRAAVGLLGDRLAAVLVAEHAPADGDDDDDADDAGDGEDRPLQVLDLLGVRALRLPRVLRGVLGTARHHQHEGAERHRRDPGATGDRRAAGHGRDASPGLPRPPRALVLARRPCSMVRSRAHGTLTSTLAVSTPGTTNAYGLLGRPARHRDRERHQLAAAVLGELRALLVRLGLVGHGVTGGLVDDRAGAEVEHEATGLAALVAEDDVRRVGLGDGERRLLAGDAQRLGRERAVLAER